MAERRVIQTVLFDLGDTLLNFHPSSDPRPYLADGIRLGHEYLASLGLTPPPLAQYARAVRRATLRSYLWSLVARREARLAEALRPLHASLGMNLDPDTLEELAWQLYIPMRRAGVADPQARPMLMTLRERGYALGVISNTGTPSTALDRHLEEEGLLEFFPMRVYSCVVGYQKPHRRIFEIALERMEAEAGSTVYVGDKVGPDVKGAGRLGMLTVLKAPMGAPRNSPWRADHIVRSLEEIPPILETYGPPCRSN
ncbi:MAG: HAD family hydrolase [bacterium]|nr:HAD family hydrolase [bacterium]